MDALLHEPLEVIAPDDYLEADYLFEVAGLDGVRTWTICNGTGTIGDACVTYKDKDRVYLDFHAGF